MLPQAFLLLGALASSYVSAAPTVSFRSPGSNWTIHDFTRTCNDTSNACLYKYSINENDGTPTTNCSYTILGTATVSARKTDYTALAGCASPAYSLNQGWDDAGQFATLVVTNTTSQYRVFYGFGLPQLADGVVQSDQVATSSASGVAPVGKRLLEARAPAWIVEGFEWESYAPLSSTFFFTVNSGSSFWECTIFDAPADPKDSWYGLPCAQDAKHVISWGYNSEGFAVMTVADYSVGSGSVAWFGYNAVNTWGEYASSAINGPNAVTIY